MNRFIIILSLIISTIGFAVAAPCGVSEAMPSCGCEKEILSVSALNRATDIAETLTTIRLMSGERQGKAYEFLKSKLENEVEISKSILVQIEFFHRDRNSKTTFEESSVGTSLRRLLAQDSKPARTPASFLPANLRNRLGAEGVTLFDALSKGRSDQLPMGLPCTAAILHRS